jgi:hypothetical protein
MEEPSKTRRKVVVVLLSPTRSRVFVRKDNDKWNVPNSHIHWPLGRKRTGPLGVASSLIKDLTLGMISIKNSKSEMQKGVRKKIPSGGFVYVLEMPNLVDIAENVKNVQKYLRLDQSSEMHDIATILKIQSMGKYGGETIEVLRLIK